MWREIPSFVYDPSCVLYLPLWKRDGTSFISDDSYGYLATVTSATWGIQGRAFGGAGFIDLGNPTALNSFTDQITLVAWVKCTGTEGVIIGKSANAAHDDPYYDYVLLNAAPNGKTHFRLSSSAYTGGIVINDNAWHHVVGTYDGITMRVFVDTVADTTLAKTGNLAAGARNVRIGGRHTTTLAEYLNGTVGEVLIYNRALTTLEIGQNYLATKWRYL